MFERLDFLYMPTDDVAEEVEHFTSTFGAEVVFAIGVRRARGAGEAHRRAAGGDVRRPPGGRAARARLPRRESERGRGGAGRGGPAALRDPPRPVPGAAYAGGPPRRAVRADAARGAGAVQRPAGLLSGW